MFKKYFQMKADKYVRQIAEIEKEHTSDRILLGVNYIYTYTYTLRDLSLAWINLKLAVLKSFLIIKK